MKMVWNRAPHIHTALLMENKLHRAPVTTEHLDERVRERANRPSGSCVQQCLKQGGTDAWHGRLVSPFTKRRYRLTPNLHGFIWTIRHWAHKTDRCPYLCTMLDQLALHRPFRGIWQVRHLTRASRYITWTFPDSHPMRVRHPYNIHFMRRLCEARHGCSSAEYGHASVNGAVNVHWSS